LTGLRICGRFTEYDAYLICNTAIPLRLSRGSVTSTFPWHRFFRISSNIPLFSTVIRFCTLLWTPVRPTIAPWRKTRRTLVHYTFEDLATILPELWREKAKELGALPRAREIKTPEDLLKLIFLYLT
jgi:hypothetical protein